LELESENEPVPTTPGSISVQEELQIIKKSASDLELLDKQADRTPDVIQVSIEVKLDESHSEQTIPEKSIDDVVDLRPSSTPDTSPFIETNQELIFQTNDQAGHDHQTTIETEPVYLSNLENSQAGSSSDDIMNLASDDRVVLEPGISGNGSRVQSGSQKASNFFHAIGIDSGFGKPEYLTTTIFEEKC